jgi:hypothetical protein
MGTTGFGGGSGWKGGGTTRVYAWCRANGDTEKEYHIPTLETNEIFKEVSNAGI